MSFASVESLRSHDNVAAMITNRARAIFDRHRRMIQTSTDRMFAVLLVIEWLSGIVVAAVVTPVAWEGVTSNPQIHLLLAVWLGLVIIILPVILAWKQPGSVATRHTIAVGQVLMSALITHLTGGRIETHFLLFGSLAFLAFYRDWPVLITASVLVAVDHLVRGIYIPFSVYGVAYAEPWRWLEHFSWVIFADVFLIRACILSTKEGWDVARKRAQLELTNEIIETEVKERTADVKRREEEFRTLCQSLPTVIFKSDEAGGWDVIGHQWLDLTGTSPERAKRWWTLVPDNDQEEVQDSWKDALESGHDWHHEFCIITNGGTLKWVRCAAVKCSSENADDKQFIGTLEDVTDLKQIEEKSRRLMLLQQREDFLTMLANDLKNPIVGANRVIELLADGRLGELNDAQTDVLMRLMEGNKDLLKMIQNIISVYRYERESSALKFEPLNLPLLLQDCVAEVRPTAGERDIDIALELSDEETLCVLGDLQSIRNVIQNLLDNALKYMPDHGKISLRAYAKNGKVITQIKNTGTHIDSEQKTKLFKRPLTGVDGKKYLPKAGLGLYMCRQILEAHKGDITCESERNQGTTFTFSLPRRYRTGEYQKLIV
ncbi:MAG TPA: PAS domain-containing sensor histidine kinase [Candidatus Obscuribacterales bacterium]